MDIKEFQKVLRELSGKKRDEFFIQQTNNITQDFLNRVHKKTPVDTGLLRISWRSHVTPARKMEDGSYKSIVKNPVHYASYVEYGHRMPNGGYYEPRFMAKKSCNELEQMYPGILGSEISKWYAENLWSRKK